MRTIPLLMLIALSVYAADPQSQRDQAFRDLVTADLRRPFPKDAELSKRLAEHRRDFEQLVSMARADKELVRIAPDFTWTTSSVAWPRPDSQLGFAPARWDEYRRLFRGLGLEAGVLRPPDHRDAVYLLVQTKGLVTGGSTKGYAYSDTALEPRCESLDAPLRDEGTCFKPLDDRWYIFLQQD